MPVPNFMEIYVIDVETFHSKTQNVTLMLLEERSGDHPKSLGHCLASMNV